MQIPFNKPYLTGRETAYLQQAFANLQFAGDGPFTRSSSKAIEELLGCRRALLTPSCTHALEMAALLLEIKPGDEVIVPSFTFVSTVNAFVLRGAKPVFIDVRPDTLNFDERQFEALITPRTRAAVVMHYAGISCEMDTIGEIASRRGVALVEDNAHGFGARYRGRPLGTLGCLGTLSFHETKNLSCGEGGALIVNQPELLARAEIIREKGTDRSRFNRGEVDKYSWVDVGSSYVMGDILAAFLFAQLEEFESIQSRRRARWERYHSGLLGLRESAGVSLPTVPAECGQAYHLFYLLTRTAAERTRLIAHLKARGIHAVFHYVPLHASAMGRRLGGRAGQCPVTEDISDRLVRLPFFNVLGAEEQDFVIAQVREFYGA
ncbi:MAG: DegT/DnrJ/EryC1/StrS aminotransferase [Verrucomicrobia bacterium]|nr:DegT/DnrJ/EryC1/StrS aminotransferase [Verrucomicrobiota bacterium]